MHAAEEEQVLHDAGHARHVPVAVSANVELPQKAVHTPVALLRYGLLEDATHAVQLVALPGASQVEHVVEHERQWPVALAAVPAGHAARQEPSMKYG